MPHIQQQAEKNQEAFRHRAECQRNLRRSRCLAQQNGAGGVGCGERKSRAEENGKESEQFPMVVPPVPATPSRIIGNAMADTDLQNHLDRMRQDWDERARENARHYVATGHELWDDDAFFGPAKPRWPNRSLPTSPTSARA